MSTHKLALFAIIASLSLAACGGRALPAGPAGSAERPADAGIVLQTTSGAAAPTEAPKAEATAAPAMDARAGGNQSIVQPQPPPAIKRMVIRNADLVLIVDDAAKAVDQVTQIAESNGGYVLSTSTTNTPDGLSALMTVRVDATSYATALNRIKTLALEVRSETASGQDVTAEFVDLQSRVRNLEVMEAQLLEFVKSATNSPDMLQSYNRAMEVRGEIEQAKGRMQFLSGMSAQSTINVSLLPKAALGVLKSPVAPEWSANKTINEAGKAFTRQMQGTIDGLIWFTIVTLPALLPWLIGLFALLMIARRIWRRRFASTILDARAAKPAPSYDATTADQP
jgi:hypothetical protein